jgi:hypothetical protein
MSCPGYEELRDSLHRYPNSKLGFLVYRCTYASDHDWQVFMAYLTHSVRATLVKDKLGDIADRLDWNVQSSSSSLDRADFETVRR